MVERKESIEAPTSKKRSLETRWEKKRSELKQSFDDWMSAAEPYVDVADEGNEYVIHVELPGFDKDNVDVELNQDVLRLKAERNADSKEQSKRYLYQERAYASFRRNIYFPEAVDPSKVEGRMDKGILTLTVPKREPSPQERMTKLQLK